MKNNYIFINTKRKRLNLDTLSTNSQPTVNIGRLIGANGEWDLKNGVLIFENGNISEIKNVTKKYRKLKGMTAKELAEKLNMPTPTLSQYEQDRRRMPIEVAVEISKILKVNWWELYEVNYGRSKTK